MGPKILNRLVRDAFGGNLNLEISLESNLRNSLGGFSIAIVARIMAFLTRIESDKGSTKGIESHPNSVEILYGGNGGGDCR